MHSLSPAFLLPFLALTLASPAPAPSPDGPFPIAASSFGPNQASKINNDIQSYLATETGAAAYTAAKTALAKATDIGLLRDYRGDPLALALEYFTATVTPTWYSAIPAPVQTYVQQVGNAQAAIESSDAALTVSEPPNTAAMGGQPAQSTSKAAAEMVGVDGFGAVVAAGLAGLAML